MINYKNDFSNLYETQLKQLHVSIPNLKVINK